MSHESGGDARATSARIFARAAETLTSFLTGLDANIPFDVLGPDFLDSRETTVSVEFQKFMYWIVEQAGINKGTRGYDIELDIKNTMQAEREIEGFISWLVVERRATESVRGLIYIAVDKESLIREFLSDGEDWLDQCKTPNQMFLKFDGWGRATLKRAYRNKLYKVLLHEFGHIELHLRTMLLVDDESGDQKHDRRAPKCAPEDEREAWLWSLYWWAYLIGENAWLARQAGADDTWKVA